MQGQAEVVEYLKDEYEIPIHVDKKALAEEGVDSDEPVVLHVPYEDRPSLRDGLRRLLNPLGLTWVIKNQVLLITTKVKAEQDKAFHETGDTAHSVNNLLYERPTLAHGTELFHNLAGFAPGLQITVADVLTLLAAEGPAGLFGQAGAIDPAAAPPMAGDRD